MAQFVCFATWQELIRCADSLILIALGTQNKSTEHVNIKRTVLM